MKNKDQIILNKIFKSNFVLIKLLLFFWLIHM